MTENASQGNMTVGEGQESCRKMADMQQAASALPNKAECSPGKNGALAEEMDKLGDKAIDVAEGYGEVYMQDETIKFGLVLAGASKELAGTVTTVGRRVTGDAAMDNVMACALFVDWLSVRTTGKDAGAVEGVRKAVAAGWKATPEALGKAVDTLPVIKDKLEEGAPAMWNGFWEGVGKIFEVPGKLSEGIKRHL